MTTMLSARHLDEAIAVERPSARSTTLHVCAECRHAQLFAVQPRAVCTCEGSPWAGKVLFAGQPACADMSPRDGGELILSTSVPGVKETGMRFVSASSLIH